MVKRSFSRLEKTPAEKFWHDWGFLIGVSGIAFGLVFLVFFGELLLVPAAALLGTVGRWAVLHGSGWWAFAAILGAIALYVGIRILIIKAQMAMGLADEDALTRRHEPVVGTTFSALFPIAPPPDGKPGEERDASGELKKDPWVEMNLAGRKDRAFFEARPAPKKDKSDPG